ncbi:alcohol dehydrogenase catalytic domain-containing protein, partial [Christensenellaceae bacterium OttesenSCG-928-L17]|nr:alcohol dehydrogenase catalytic domain-containing protein [Christensenellaceae bacterium OttesenSCG-928-L17]
MKALYFDKTLRYREDMPMPERKAGESLVRVELAAICNTDREVLRGYKPGYKGVLGHEFSGIVEQSENAALINKRVVAELNLGCRECLYCKSGREKHCVSRRVLGLNDMDGCFASYVSLNNRLLHVVPAHVTAKEAVFIEPLAAALQVAECAHIRPSTPVAVVGDGRLAYFVAQVLALQGTAVTVFGKHAEKLEAFAPFAETSLKINGSFETVVEATGAPAGLRTALRLVRSGGLIVLKSTYAMQEAFDMSELVVREITLTGSRCGPFAPAIALLSRGQIRLPELELHPLVDFEAAFASRAFKVGFDLNADA